VISRPFWLHILRVLALWFAFLVLTYHLDHDSLALDEGWTMWAVRPNSPVEMMRRIVADVHPPLYFMLLDGWTALAGESVYVARMPSIFFALLGLAASYALGRKLFDHRTGMITLIYLGTAGFTVYYAREARMYAQFMAFSVSTTWIYVLWHEHPTRSRMTLYIGLTLALLYTHYNGAWLVLAHGLHALLSHPRRPAWLFLALIIAIGFVPWLPALVHQTQTHPVQQFAVRQTRWEEVRWLFFLLTSLYWLVTLAPLVLGRALPHLLRQRNTLSLLILWIGLTPAVVFIINAWGRQFYQPRYVISLVPGVAMLMAYATRQVFWRPAVIGFVITITVIQLGTYPVLWPTKSPWRTVIAQVVETRDPGVPLIATVEAHSVAAYYDRQLGLREGRVMDFTGQEPDPQQIHSLLATLADTPSVWVAMSLNSWTVWTVAGVLDQTRRVGFRDGITIVNGVDNMVFYRFDAGDDDDLAFRFGDLLAYEGRIGTEQPIQAGENFCAALPFYALSSFTNRYSIGLHVLDQSHHLVAQYDEGLNLRTSGETFTWKPCISIPSDLPPGSYYLVLVVYRWDTIENIPIFEGPIDQSLFWGDLMIWGQLDVVNGPQ